MTESEAIKIIDNAEFLTNRDADYAMSVIEAIETAKAALEKQIPKRPYFTEDKEFVLCPCCNGKGLSDKQNYCDNCGQKLDWSDENEEID